MKILFLSGGFPPNSNAGAEKIAFNLAKGFQKLGEQVYVITTVQEKSQAGKLNYQGLTVFQIYTNYHQRWQNYLSLYNPQTVSRVRTIIKQIQPDITHVHVPHHYLSYHCLKIAKKYSRAVFLSAHDVMLFHCGKLFEFINPDELSIPNEFNYKITPWQQIKRFKKRYNPFRNIIIKHYLKYVDKIFVVSYALKDALAQNGIKNIEVIYNGIDVNKWQVNNNKINSFKKRYNLIDKKVIFFGGRLSALKGGEKILESLKIIIQELPETVLLLVGKKDDYIQRMLDLARMKNLPLEFAGWLEGDELKAAYFCSDIVVTPSLCFDAFNMVNLEAMACQKPVVTTCFGGVPEVIENGLTGYLVNPFHVEKLAERILDLLTNSKKAKEFGQNGLKRVKKNFLIEKQIKKTLKWYKNTDR